MSTVYITQDGVGRNFLPARTYGDLVMLTPSNAQITFSSQPVLGTLQTKLANFSDEDYLLMSGDPLIMGIALAIALDVNEGFAKCLKWDKRERIYYSVQIDMLEKGEDYSE